MALWSYDVNPGMKVFSQLYVGTSEKRGGESIPLAFATPYETNAAGRKRQETVKSWVNSRRKMVAKDGFYVRDESGNFQYEDDSHEFTILDNVPREGFRITNDIRRVYYGGGNVVWRVADPDGWEVEIQSPNLFALLIHAGIQPGGVINGKCVWGRADGINVLLHETSTEYANAIKAAETLKAPTQVAKSARKVGGVYKMTTGFGLYLGKLNATCWKPTEGFQSPLEVLFLGDTSVELQPSANADLFGREKRYSKRNGASHTHNTLHPSEEYEAVLFLTKRDDGRITEYPSITLYKKAPLLEFVEDYDKLTLTDEWLATKKVDFASAALKNAVTKVASLTLKPIKNPVIVFSNLSDEEKAMFKDRERVYSYGNSHILQGLGGQPLERVLYINGKYYHGGWNSFTYESSPLYPVEFTSRSCHSVEGAEYHWRDSYYYGSYRYGSEHFTDKDMLDTGRAAVVQVIKGFPTKQEATAYFDKLIEDNVFLKVSIADDPGIAN